MAYILDLRCLPDSTLSIGASSNGVLKRSVPVREPLGCTTPGWRFEQRRDPNPAWPLGLIGMFPKPNPLMEEMRSVIDRGEPPQMRLALLGDMGGESAGGERGGEVRIEVGEVRNDAGLVRYESKL